MSTVATIPTLEQSCALAELVRRGQLTDEHRHPHRQVARRDRHVGAHLGADPAALPGHPEYMAAVWTPVGTAYGRLLDAVRPVAAQ